jgi:hypothetical protein
MEELLSMESVSQFAKSELSTIQGTNAASRKPAKFFPRIS